MISEIANEFENITKFSLLEYLIKYRDFLQNDYSDIYSYYSGNVETISAEKLNNLSELLNLSNDLIRTFQTFSGKLGNVGYWELQRYCQDLKDTIERISKLPKYCRTAKTSRGYKPYVQIDGEIGGMKTVQDLSEQLGGMSEIELIVNNDLQESDYEIDELKVIKALVNNKNDVVVNTILEPPIGKRIYGKDIKRKLSFVDNDLETVKYEDNVEQKCNVLLELNKGDVPEFPNFGKNVSFGSGMRNYNYAELILDIKNNFDQDDLFSDINITNITPDKKTGTITLSVAVQTKYAYSTTQSIEL